MGDRNNSKLKLVHSSKTQKDDLKGSSRILLSLTTSLENTDEEVAQDLANKLSEEKEDLIRKYTVTFLSKILIYFILERIVKAVGKAKAIDIYNEVKRIEKDGGMLVMVIILYICLFFILREFGIYRTNLGGVRQVEFTYF